MFRPLLLAPICLAAALFAQDEGTGGGGGGMGGRGGGMSGGMGGDMGGGGMPRMARQSKLEIFSDKLKLNKDQQQELLKILAAGREEASPLHEAIDKERANIANAILNSKPEVEKKAVEDLTALRARMVAVEAKAFGKVIELVKPKDVAKAAQAFELMAGMFDQTMGGGRGGRGMRGGRN